MTNTIEGKKTFLIFDINHPTKHQEVRPDWNDKNDNANRALVSHGEVLPMAQVAIFKNIRSSAKRFRLWIILFWLKRHNVSHYIYYLATDNIHIVLENDNTVLIKGLKGCKC